MILSKLFKTFLALTASAAFLYGAQSWAKSPAPEPTPPAAAPAPAASAKKPPAAAAAAPAASARTIAIKVTEEGYEPSPIKLKKGEPVKLVITRTTDKTCATEILIDKTDINVPLPLNKPVEVAFTPQNSGQLKYGCAMGKMISGIFLVE